MCELVCPILYVVPVIKVQGKDWYTEKDQCNGREVGCPLVKEQKKTISKRKKRSAKENKSNEPLFVH